MDEDIVLKIKEKVSLEIIKNIAIVYSIFLFFYALILGYKETIIQVTFILVFSAIVNILNYGQLVVNEKGINTKNTGFIKYTEIYRIELKNRILTIHIRSSKKPLKIIFSKNEDYKLIEKGYKYIDSKLKRIEEDTKEHEEYIKKYLQ